MQFLHFVSILSGSHTSSRLKLAIKVVMELKPNSAEIAFSGVWLSGSESNGLPLLCGNHLQIE